jgi:hypothetical protein
MAFGGSGRETVARRRPELEKTMRYIIFLTIAILLCGVAMTGCDDDHRRHRDEWSGPAIR